MKTGRPHQQEIGIEQDGRFKLKSLARALSTTSVRRAGITLMPAEDKCNSPIMQMLNISNPIACMWRMTFLKR